MLFIYTSKNTSQTSQKQNNKGVYPLKKTKKICFKQSQKQHLTKWITTLSTHAKDSKSQNDSDKLYVPLCKNIIFNVLIKHPSGFCDTHSFSPSFLVTGRVCSLQSYVWSLMLHISPSLVYLFGWQKSFAFLPLQRHTGIWAFTHGVKV